MTIARVGDGEIFRGRCLVIYREQNTRQSSPFSQMLNDWTLTGSKEFIEAFGVVVALIVALPLTALNAASG